MKKILAFTDQHHKPGNITKAAAHIAERTQASLVLAAPLRSHNPEFSIFENPPADAFLETVNVSDHMSDGFLEKVHFDLSFIEGLVDEIDYSKLDDREIELVISGTSPTANLAIDEKARNILNKNHCPLMVLPRGRKLAGISKIGYITDVRFCDSAITVPLARLCKQLRAELVFIHVNLSGLPEIEPDYAEDIFKSTILPRLGYKNAVFVQMFGRELVSELENVNEVLKPDALAVCGSRYGLYDPLFEFRGNPEPKYSEVPLIIYP